MAKKHWPKNEDENDERKKKNFGKCLSSTLHLIPWCVRVCVCVPLRLNSKIRNERKEAEKLIEDLLHIQSLYTINMYMQMKRPTSQSSIQQQMEGAG